METINDRMQMIVNNSFDGNKTAFAKAIGIAPTSISNYLGKQRASRPSSELLEKIVNSLGVDAKWLLTGKESCEHASIEAKLTAEMEALRQENISLRAEVERLKALRLPTKDSKIYNVWMKFMEITKEMQELYKEEKGE